MKNKRKYLSFFARATTLLCVILIQISASRAEFDEDFIQPVHRLRLEDHPIDLQSLAKEALVEANISWHQAWLHRRDASEAKHLLDISFFLGDQEAAMRLVHVLSEPLYGYDVDEQMLNKSKLLNDVLVEFGNFKAIRRAIYGYTYEIFGYEHNPADAKELIEKHVKEDHEWAIKLMLTGWAFGVYGFQQDKNKALEWNNERVARGDKEALKRMTDDFGLPNNFYGYKFNPPLAKRLVTFYAKRQEVWALKRMAIGYSTGAYGFKINHKRARKINRKLLRMKNQGARKRVVIGHIWGCNGYTKNIDIGYGLARRWSIHDFGQDKYYQATYKLPTG